MFTGIGPGNQPDRSVAFRWGLDNNCVCADARSREIAQEACQTFVLGDSLLQTLCVESYLLLPDPIDGSSLLVLL